MSTGKKLPVDGFMSQREKVLEMWKTGSEVDLVEALRYHHSLPTGKNFARALWSGHQAGWIMLQPRAGVALIDEDIRLLQYLQKEGAADLLPLTIDAYTRQNHYEEAQLGIQRSLRAHASLLNGFPAVNHGVYGTRHIVDRIEKPIEVRHGTPDARLLAEITLAAGLSGFEGGGISYNIPYAKNVPLAKSIADWQYVDRLVGWYEENGVSINREPFGPLTGTLIPPCISHAVAIIEGLLALQQGVRSITLGYGQLGNLQQDMAAMISLRELAEEYFEAEGFYNYELTTVFHQWMGGFPRDEAKALAVISWGGVVAFFAKADKVIVKTPHEAVGVPTMEANAQGLRATRQAINMLQDQKIYKNKRTQREIDLIKTEVRCLLDKVYELGNGNVAAGTIAAFEAGTLDVPFAPSLYTKGKVLPIRDNEGYTRLLQIGNLSLSDDVLAYHKEQVRKRAAAEGREVSFQMVTDDINAISKGHLVGRPR